MNFLRKEPGVVFATIFVIMGLSFVAVVAVGERVSPVAGKSFSDGIVNGGDWQKTQFPPVPFN